MKQAERNDRKNNDVSVPAASVKQDRERAEVFEYLEILRQSGITNMFGAGPYIVEQFDGRYTRGRGQGTAEGMDGVVRKMRPSNENASDRQIPQSGIAKTLKVLYHGGNSGGKAWMTQKRHKRTVRLAFCVKFSWTDHVWMPKDDKDHHGCPE